MPRSELLRVCVVAIVGLLVAVPSFAQFGAPPAGGQPATGQPAAGGFGGFGGTTPPAQPAGGGKLEQLLAAAGFQQGQYQVMDANTVACGVQMNEQHVVMVRIEQDKLLMAMTMVMQLPGPPSAAMYKKINDINGGMPFMPKVSAGQMAENQWTVIAGCGTFLEDITPALLKSMIGQCAGVAEAVAPDLKNLASVG